MNMPRDDKSVTAKYAQNIFGILLERIFMVLQDGIHYRRFIAYARKGTEESRAAAAEEFRTVWKIIAHELHMANAPVSVDEAIEICQQFFFDPDDSSKDYSEIAIDILWEDANSFLTFIRERSQLEKEEQFRIQSIELKNDLVREDLLRSLIQLAFLPTKLLPDSPHLVDRQKATFAENLRRLILVYLPEAKLKVSTAELKTLIPAEIKKLKNRPSLLKLIDDYEEELAKAEEEEILELTEEIIEPEKRAAIPEAVEVKIVIIDKVKHIFGIAQEKIEFTPMGILKAIKAFAFDPENSQEFSDNVAGLLFKIMEVLRENSDKTQKLNKAFALLGEYKSLLYEILKIANRQLKDKTPETLGKKEKMFYIVKTVVNKVDYQISEMMPMSMKAHAYHGIRIQDPKDQQVQC